MGNNNESVVHPVLDCLVNPKAVTLYTNFISMTKKVKIVTSTAICNGVAPTVAFYQKYFNYLPTSTTRNEAFAKASLDYFNLFQSFPYLCYEQFKNTKHGKARA